MLTNFLIFLIDYFGDLFTYVYDLFAKLIKLRDPTNVGMPFPRPNDINPYFFNPYMGQELNRGMNPSKFPSSWIEAIFGNFQTMNHVPIFMFQSKEDGFYNFYVYFYTNIFFLPDWLSKFLQIDCNIYLDTTILEVIQESIFVFLVAYLQLIYLRLNLYWFITINPFSRPWVYLTTLVDWLYDFTGGFIPGLLGIDVGFVLFMSGLGRFIDWINFLVFTMPYLPSEGVIGVLDKTFNGNYTQKIDFNFLTDDKIKEVIFFKNFPALWYYYPIPNELREYWFYNRPDILKYMIDHYDYLGVNFYPDGYNTNSLETLSSNSISEVTNYLTSLDILPEIKIDLLKVIVENYHTIF